MSATGESGAGVSGAGGTYPGAWFATGGNATGPPALGTAANVPCGPLLSAWWATVMPSTVIAAPIT